LTIVVHHVQEVVQRVALAPVHDRDVQHAHVTSKALLSAVFAFAAVFALALAAVLAAVLAAAHRIPTEELGPQAVRVTAQNGCVHQQHLALLVQRVLLLFLQQDLVLIPVPVGRLTVPLQQSRAEKN
jgi:hypothetical protein